MIKEIFLGTDTKGFESVKTNKKDIIQNISRVNIFIGPNNSGKSRLIRTFFSDDDFCFSQIKLNDLNIFLSDIKKTIESAYRGTGVSFSVTISPIADQITQIPYSTIKQNRFAEFIQSIIRNIEIVITNTYRRRSNEENEFLTKMENARIHLNEILDADSKYEFQKYYIPILRGLRPIQFKDGDTYDGTMDVYRLRTFSDYFKKLNLPNAKIVQDSIFTGLEIYGDVKRKLLQKKDERNKIQQFEKFLKENFFPDKDISLIPEIDKDVLLVGIGDNKEPERELYHLGDGIQAIIQMLYPIFMRKGENAIFFIEEPELSLHPGMQRLFLNTLLSDDFASMQFFLTTHSNHFLDITNDDDNISIYSFKKSQEGKFQIRTLDGPENHVLNEIGVRNSSVFLANCSIWVEGITDRKYIRRFLDVYKKKHSKTHYLEDLHYTFVEYAGSNIVHWDFNDADNKESDNINALRHNNKIFLIADSDIDNNGKTSKYKAKLHEGLRVALEENFHLTEGKEIENMLSAKVISRIIEEYENSDSLEFKVDFNSTRKLKSFNSEEKISKPIYWKYNVGEYIDKNLKGRKHTYQERTTVRYKDAFCEKAIKNINSTDDLSEEALKLCKKLMKFIEESNA